MADRGPGIERKEERLKGLRRRRGRQALSGRSRWPGEQEMLVRKARRELITSEGK